MNSRSQKNHRIIAVLVLTLLLLSIGCQTAYVRRDPTGEVFPSVNGTSLEGQAVSIPTDWNGERILLLVGFEQNTQFDLDRWALALADTGLDLRAVEIPTIRGLVPSLISDRIDSGMRRGIPSEDWASVVTVYEEADRIASFTGNANPLTGRVLMLDESGRVAFFHDRGYSVSAFARLVEVLGEQAN